MRTLVLPVSRRCNNACLFCDVHRSVDGERVPAATIKARLDEAHAQGTRRLVLTGGEPLMARHVVRAIAYAHGLGWHTSVTTNGRLLGDAGIAGRLAAAGLDALTLSLHAVDPEVHGRLVGVPHAHGQALAGLRHALDAGLSVTLRCVLTRHNRDELLGLVGLAAELGTPLDVRALRLHGAAREADDLVLAPASALSALREALGEAERRGVSLTFSGFRSLARLEWPTMGAGPAPNDLASRRLLDAGVLDAPLRRALPEPLRPTGDLARWRALDAPVPSAPRDPVLSADRPIHLVADLAPDDPLAVSADLMGLGDALEARGVVLARHTAWRAPMGEDGLPRRQPRGLLEALRRDRRPELPWEIEDVDLPGACTALLDQMNLAGAGAVIVRGLRVAHLVRQRPRLPKDLRLVVLDADPREDTPFQPGPRDLLVTPFPRLLDAWEARGVPLARVLSWPPLVDPRPLPARAADDHVTLLAGPALDEGLARSILDVLPGRHRVIGLAPPDLGPAMPSAPREALGWLATSRWLVVPHRDRTPDAPTMAWLARAASLGIPVIGTTTHAVDALYDVGTGVGVVPGDIFGMRRALTEVDHERRDAFHARLKGLRRLTSPDRLARLLLEGRRDEDVPIGPVGPW